jgi:hypothetical protein
MQKFHHAAVRNANPMDQVRMGRIYLHPQHRLIRASKPRNSAACNIRRPRAQLGQAACAGSAYGLKPVLPQQVNQPNQRGK